MTIEKLTELLQESSADAWTLTDERKTGWQFYFIRHRLDQNRAVNTEHATVTLYLKSADGKMLGSASEEIALSASEEETRRALRELLSRAGYVQNPVYELRSPAAGERENGRQEKEALSGPASEAAAARDVAAVSGDFIRVMTSLPETPTEDINSYEIFTDRITRRLITSTGIDVTQTYPSSMLEVVTNARESGRGGASAAAPHGQDAPAAPSAGAENSGKAQAAGGREIELYRMYLSGTCDAAGLRKDITKTLHYGRDRLHTVPTPQVGRIPVVFSTADSVQLYDYFVSRLNAQMVYQKTSDWKIGTPIADEVRGDRITIMAKQFLPNSSRNFRFDAEGAPIRDELLMQDDVPENYWGDAMYSSYLGLKNTFHVSNYAVSGGTHTEAEIRSGHYLEVVEFSDFQADAVTGSIFGEIRLGYLHDGNGNTQIVSGGSVSGSLRDYAANMLLSKEIVQYDNALVPALTKLMDVTVTGAR